MINEQEKLINQKKKVAIYLRVSTDDQADMYGLENQLSKIKSYLNVRNDALELVSDNYIGSCIEE